MAESGGLENRCTRKGTVGSNPTLSAIEIVTSDKRRVIKTVFILSLFTCHLSLFLERCRSG